MSAIPRNETRAWRALGAHRREIAELSLREAFAGDPQRGDRFRCQAAGWTLDYSKNLITERTLSLLLGLAEACDVREHIAAMFAGERINVTEARPALHVALRAPRTESIETAGRNVVPDVHAVLDRMSSFAAGVRDGTWKGHTGKSIRNVVNIGIGGSDLGPRMATAALRHYASRDLRVRHISNVDATDFFENTRDLDPAETLFIICSKSFTTLETLHNAQTARSWCVSALADERAVAKHFVAVSTNAAAVRSFGIEPDNMFEFWDWVGGRYSLCSAVGISLMLAIGPERFHEMLEGFHELDEHFRSAPFERNLPLLLGLLGVWHHSFCGAESHAILPYDQYLALLSNHVQQLDMESNGKRVDVDGATLEYGTAPVIWGQPGTDGQHAFFQLLHQGNRLVPCDFIGFANSLHPIGRHHDLLMANFFAQTEALAFGRTSREVAATGVPDALVPHRTFPGNRPTNSLLCATLTPRSLGSLLALYEHKAFVQGTVWNVNPFDQWGVELGKELAARIVPELDDAAEPDGDPDGSTRGLIRLYRSLRTRD